MEGNKGGNGDEDNDEGGKWLAVDERLKTATGAERTALLRSLAKTGDDEAASQDVLLADVMKDFVSAGKRGRA